jgi:hypothetical protein
VLLLALIPNPLSGRLAFICCGGLVATIGLILIASGRKTDAANAANRPSA